VNLLVDVQIASSEAAPTEKDFHQWISVALDGQTTLPEVEISLRVVDNDEMSQLNQTYRGKKGPTNVLSFPADLPPELALPLLGDIVICAPVVAAEAAQQGKTLSAHWAHMTVHGTLHLLGFDHREEDDAVVMESLETTILSQLNYDCPYEAQPRQEHF
jgi:probable rRNA maturation factor